MVQNLRLMFLLLQVVKQKELKQHQITQECIPVWLSKVVGRRCHEEYFRALLVHGDVNLDASDVLNVLREKLEGVFETVRLNTQVVASAVAVGDRLHDPVHVDAQQVQQLAGHHGDLGSVDAVRAVDAAAAALCALEEVVVPLLEHLLGELAPARQGTENPACGREVLAINGSQELRAQHRHVLGVTRADEEVALVGAGAAPHADVHEDLERAVLLQQVLEAFMDDLFPVLGQLPVGIRRRPVARIGLVEVFQVLDGRWI